MTQQEIIQRFEYHIQLAKTMNLMSTVRALIVNIADYHTLMAPLGGIPGLVKAEEDKGMGTYNGISILPVSRHITPSILLNFDNLQVVKNESKRI